MGYDTGLPHDDVESALRKLYSSCGEITDVYVPIDYQWENTLSKCSFVYFVGEGAVDKALLLNGADVGGWNVSAEAYPFQRYAKYLVSVTVKGYDTSLDEIDIENELTKLFSSCGEVTEVMVNDDGFVASSSHLWLLLAVIKEMLTKDVSLLIFTAQLIFASLEKMW